MSFDKYADWFVDCINCKDCDENYLSGEKDGRGKGFICNDNIKDRRDDKATCPIRPQAGYIDEKWFDMENDSIHILLLGQNPFGGYDKDDDLYNIYDDIIKGIATVFDKIKTISAQVMGYRPSSHLQSDIINIFKEQEKGKSRKVKFAYANQILCRTHPEAGSIRNKVYFQDVYQKCFENHVNPLIEMIRPELIIVLGWTTESPFRKLISNSSSHDLKYVVVPHPTRRKTEALKQIEEFANNFS